MLVHLPNVLPICCIRITSRWFSAAIAASFSARFSLSGEPAATGYVS
jgi:hypothetical protein